MENTCKLIKCNCFGYKRFITVYKKTSEEAIELRKLAKGNYQLELLEGRHSWSGASLKGLARQYGGKYKASRNCLINRIANSFSDAMYVLNSFEHNKATVIVKRDNGDWFIV